MRGFAGLSECGLLQAYGPSPTKRTKRRPPPQCTHAGLLVTMSPRSSQPLALRASRTSDKTLGARQVEDRAPAVLCKDIGDGQTPLLRRTPRAVVHPCAARAVRVRVAIGEHGAPLGAHDPVGARRAVRGSNDVPVDAAERREAVAAARCADARAAVADFLPCV